MPRLCLIPEHAPAIGVVLLKGGAIEGQEAVPDHGVEGIGLIQGHHGLLAIIAGHPGPVGHGVALAGGHKAPAVQHQGYAALPLLRQVGQATGKQVCPGLPLCAVQRAPWRLIGALGEPPSVQLVQGSRDALGGVVLLEGNEGALCSSAIRDGHCCAVACGAVLVPVGLEQCSPVVTEVTQLAVQHVPAGRQPCGGIGCLQQCPPGQCGGGHTPSPRRNDHPCSVPRGHAGDGAVQACHQPGGGCA